MRFARTTVGLFAALVIATTTMAQDDGSIIVTGRADIDKQIEEYVGALTPAPPRGQIARFEHEICPRAIGFDETQRFAVENRIRRVARGVGMKATDKRDCRINLLVIAAPDKKAFAGELARKHAFLFGDRTPTEIRRILAQEGSALSWQVEGKLNADGHPLDETTGIPINRTGRAESRITATARPYIQGAVVIFDSKAMVGLTINQVADYALMRGFTKVDIAKLDATAAPTILRALDAPDNAEVPLTLTSWDFALLKGLYSSANNLYAPSLRSDIRRSVEKEAASTDAVAIPEPDRPKG